MGICRHKKETKPVLQYNVREPSDPEWVADFFEQQAAGA
jgi:hypothetical protein